MPVFCEGMPIIVRYGSNRDEPQQNTALNLSGRMKPGACSAREARTVPSPAKARTILGSNEAKKNGAFVASSETQHVPWGASGLALKPHDPFRFAHAKQRRTEKSP